jgi:hypothetical protein
MRPIGRNRSPSGTEVLRWRGATVGPASGWNRANYLINGVFIWDDLPEIIQVPASAGILSLTVDGREIAEPDLDR